MSIYSYKYRPHYGYTGFLIEFFEGSSSENLLNDTILALKAIQPKALPVMDLWMNDEIMAPFESSIGGFEISKDIYDNVFILGEEAVTKKIHELLNKDPKFKSLEVNFDDYQLKET